MGVHFVPAGNAVSEISQSREIRTALQWLTREKQWIAETHLQVCRIPAPTFLEQKRAEWMAHQFHSYGWHSQIDRAGNVVASLKSSIERPLIAVTAHLDTVFAPRLKDDIFVDSEGKLRGPGVSDNGAGLSSVLAIARAIQLSGLPEDRVADLLLVANVGEEGEGNLSGMRFLCKQSPFGSRIQAFVVVDGATTDHITVRGLGSRRFDLTFTGSGGHSWSDFGAGNPIHALARAISFFSDARVAGTPRSSINVGVMEGGVSVNSIPAHARAKIDIRSESNEKMDELVVVLHDAVERAQEIENQRASLSKASGGRVAARLKEIGFRPAARLPEEAPLLAYARAVDAYLGIRAQLECASTDANVPLSMNLPAISIGAGGHGGGAHTAQEWFSPEGRDLGLKRILLLAVMLMRYGAE